MGLKKSRQDLTIALEAHADRLVRRIENLAAKEGHPSVTGYETPDYDYGPHYVVLHVSEDRGAKTVKVSTSDLDTHGAELQDLAMELENTADLLDAVSNKSNWVPDWSHDHK